MILNISHKDTKTQSNHNESVFFQFISFCALETPMFAKLDILVPVK